MVCRDAQCDFYDPNDSERTDRKHPGKQPSGFDDGATRVDGTFCRVFVSNQKTTTIDGPLKNTIPSGVQ